MAKPSKSPSPKQEFLENRRKAIKEMAAKRRKETAMQAANVTVAGASKPSARFALTGTPPPASPQG